MAAARYERFLLEGEALPAANALMVPSFESSGEWTGVWAHEYFHFLQFAGTHAGQLLAHMFASIGHSAGAFLRDPPDGLKRKPIWRFPVLLWATFEQNPALALCLRRHFGFLLLQAETLRLYLGQLPTLGAGNRWTAPKHWAWSTRPPKEAIFPLVTSRAGRQIGVLGSLDIMESAAALQGIRMEQSELPLNDNGIGFRISDDQRRVLMAAPTRYNIGLRFVEETTAVPSGFMPSVTVLAADLALESGINDLAENKDSDSLAWEDWYPAWRFAKAVAVIDRLLLSGTAWPETERSLAQFCETIRRSCGWTHPLNAPASQLWMREEEPFRSDMARRRLAELAMRLRCEHASLWSVGPRSQLIQASLEWLRPPVIAHYGANTIRGPRSDMERDEVIALWGDAQLQHVAWQLIGDTNPHRCARRVECFPWAKEGSGSGCDYSNGHCRWFPPDATSSLPDDCPMVQMLKRLCGEYWNRLVPLASLE